ncbi:MAG: glycosyltransferase family 2 protein [Patescibacteria group bacterium]|nr:glycosyltransferase family 2 protein [Patescibacteria group bacterium]
MKKITPKNKIAVIVPIYNEEKIIDLVILELIKVCQKLKADIFVINDGSTDNTFKVVKKYSSVARIINYKKNRGKGFALRLGALHAYRQNYEVIIFFDGDGQLHPKDITKLAHQLNQKTDLIIHHRIINFRTLPLSKIGRGTVRWLFNNLFGVNIFDHLSGLKAFRAERLPLILWLADDYRVEVEILARAVINNLRYKVIKGPCDKKLYRGIGWQDGLKIYYWIFWCYFNRHKFKINGENFLNN